MRELTVDVAIIGGGTAGMSAYRSALRHTSSIVVIEADAFGTMCARSGCMPSKLLIAAAEAAHTLVDAETFGIRVEKFTIDGVAVMERVRRERDRFVGFVLDTVDSWPDEHKIIGRAQFIDAHTLQIDEHTRIHAQRIVIATGSRPVVPDEWKKTLGDRVIVNEDVFNWQRLPESVAIFGTGVIGLEIAQALHRLGVRVRLFGRSGKVGVLTDPDLQVLSKKIMTDDLPLQPVTHNVVVSRDNHQVVVQWKNSENDSDKKQEQFDYLLAATGRRPNIDTLNFAATGISTNKEGLPDFDAKTGQIGHSAIFIAGDVTNERPVLHEAADLGKIAGDNAGRYPDIHEWPRRTPLAVVFTDPQIAIAGKSFKEIKDAGIDYAMGEVSFDNQGRSRVMLKNRGALRVYAERGTGKFLGAEMICPAAEHLGHLLAWSAQRGDTVQYMLDSPFYHPVVEEGLRTALRKLQQALF
jgi:dihydrolipoamide dehydrogenase